MFSRFTQLHGDQLWKRVGFIYISSVIGASVGFAFRDADYSLQTYKKVKKENKNQYDLSSFESKLYYCEHKYDAIKTGVNYLSSERFWDSLFWPITMWDNFVPMVVYWLDTEESEKETKK